MISFINILITLYCNLGQGNVHFNDCAVLFINEEKEDADCGMLPREFLRECFIFVSFTFISKVPRKLCG